MDQGLAEPQKEKHIFQGFDVGKMLLSLVVARRRFLLRSVGWPCWSGAVIEFFELLAPSSTWL